MELIAMIAMLGLGNSTWAEPAPKVTVCLDGTREKHIASSTRLASEIFASAEVAIDWRDADSCPSSQDVIRITFSFNHSDYPNPQAFAYALPFQGRTINIFYNRIASAAHCWSPKLLAYVLVHEIVHILEGVSVHSTQGIMKATWEDKELAAIQSETLSFTEKDISLIHSGLQWRARRAAQHP
jgi:hypothetical protein